MYDEYEVVYESSVNEYLTLYIVIGICIAILAIITLIGLSRVFKKANRSSVAAFIPFYNFYILLEVANMQKSYFLPLLIPIVNIPILLNVNTTIANLFKKSKSFGIGMTFLPFIYYPILAFSSSEYVGINLSGMNSQVENIPVIDDNKNQEKQIQVNEEVKPTVSISTGLGKLENKEKKEVDFDKLLQKQEKPQEEVQETKPIDPTVGAQLKTADDIYSVNYIDTNPQTTVNQDVVQPQVSTIPQSVPQQASQVVENIPAPQPQQQNPQVAVNNIQPQVQQQSSTPTNTKVDLLASNTVSVEESGYKLCPNCKTRVVDGAEICLICGQKLN